MYGILKHMEYLVAVFVFIFGLLIGSFVNVLALRFGFSETPRHRSSCQACAHVLQWFELVPVISYVVLRGKCSTCGSAIAAQYSLVELLVGGLFVATYLAAWPISSIWHVFSFVSLLVFWASFVLLLIYDVRHTLVPTIFVVPLALAAIMVRISETAFVSSVLPLQDAAIGALLLGGVFFVLVLVTRGRGMGLGDVYIAASLGILFGAGRGIEVVTLAFWIGAAVGIVLMLVKRQVRMKSEVPFVPFLFVAAALGTYTALSPFALVGALTTLLIP